MVSESTGEQIVAVHDAARAAEGEREVVPSRYEVNEDAADEDERRARSSPGGKK